MRESSSLYRWVGLLRCGDNLCEWCLSECGGKGGGGEDGGMGVCEASASSSKEKDSNSEERRRV